MILSHCGIATHFVPSVRLNDLQKRLCDLETSDLSTISQTISEFSGEVPEHFKHAYTHQRESIDQIFSKNSIEEILASLKSLDLPWSKETAALLEKKSPTSLKVHFY